jgi:hypothetical protein
VLLQKDFLSKKFLASLALMFVRIFYTSPFPKRCQVSFRKACLPETCFYLSVYRPVNFLLVLVKDLLVDENAFALWLVTSKTLFIAHFFVVIKKVLDRVKAQTVAFAFKMRADHAALEINCNHLKF